MSHVIQCKGTYNNEWAFFKTIWGLGLIPNLSKKTFKWYEEKEDSPCSFVFSLPHSSRGYEVGVTLKDGVYTMQYDPYDYDLAQVMGNEGEKFSIAYNKELVALIAEEEGHSVVSSEVLKDGSIEMYLEVEE